MAHSEELSLALWIWLWSTPSMNYAIYPVVQTITSEDLRAHVFKAGCDMTSCECESCIRCSTRTSSIQEEIELQRA